MVQMGSEGNLWENSSSLGEVTLLVLFRPSSDLTRPSNVLEDILLCLKFTNLNVNFIQNILQVDRQS